MIVRAALVEALFEANELARFDQLMQQLPEYAEKEPWVLTRLRGEHGLQREDYVAAEKYFRVMLTHDPANAPSQMGLATALAEQGKQAEHESALQRSGVLAEIRVNLTNAQADAVAALRELAEKCRQAEFETAAQTFTAHAEAAAAQEKPAANEVPQP
jgi:predicted Zn-dependent protease